MAQVVNTQKSLRTPPHVPTTPPDTAPPCALCAPMRSTTRAPLPAADRVEVAAMVTFCAKLSNACALVHRFEELDAAGGEAAEEVAPGVEA